ncbi:MAG: ubiquinone biosynthesis regulatory protein kinase UbiB [Gammaproteobacteria bacterium]|nr:ubiquinone biosynthesis regulatory protein kinase UbiB [Gammaproteobacteria bacterium]MCW8987477.1 ubiquinone biosynthesis regulatory protein kinase UbiB [Gammaproteobacteria bacterium]MCW9030859.1 ubiquinone biosynthesis regulatory protein kinase UbiB [Gammaproteobacteria bacterium]
MSYITRLLRLSYISWILILHGLDELILATHLFRPFRYLQIFMPWTWMARKTPRGIRIRQALEDLGPIFVKFGQILSTRRDLMPDDIAIELAKLQDQVTPFDNQTAYKIIEKSLGHPLKEIFSDFSDAPFASASIAQVHAATLHNGQKVIVKVLRPNIKPVIQRDISLLYIIADKIERYWPAGKNLRPKAVVAEFEKTLLDELDLMREAANASQLRRNFLNSEKIYIPEVYWDHCRRNIMVMERIHGTPIGDIDALVEKNINMQQLSERGVEIFFTQVFRHSFFHADMHPGNIFVADNGQYIAVDFGIMGTLNETDQRYLAENFLAFFNRDYRRVAELHVSSGWVGKDTRIDEFESAIRSVCEPIFDKPLKDISFGLLLLNLFQTARRFNMEVQPQLILLQKTLLNIEGLGRQLYPDLDLWKTAKPFLEQWMKDKLGPKTFFKHLKENAPLWAEQLPKMPSLFYDVLEQSKQGKLKVELNETQMQQIRDEIKLNNSRSLRAISGGSLLITAALLFNTNLAWLPVEYSHLPAMLSTALGVSLLLSLLKR